MTINQLLSHLALMANDDNLADRPRVACGIARRTIENLCNSMGAPLDMDSEAGDLPLYASMMQPSGGLGRMLESSPGLSGRFKAISGQRIVLK